MTPPLARSLNDSDLGGVRAHSSTSNSYEPAAISTSVVCTTRLSGVSANTRHACCRCSMATGVGCLRVGRLPSGIYLLLEDRGRLERQNAASRDACWLAGLRIAAQALFLSAHHERTERAQLHRLAALQRGGDSFDDLADKHLGFVTGKPDSAMYRVRQYLTINSFSHSSASLVTRSKQSAICTV